METKYYFVSYRWKNEGAGFEDWEFSNTLMNEHPLLWLKDKAVTSDDIYKIEFYEEITKELYDEVYGWVN